MCWLGLHTPIFSLRLLHTACQRATRHHTDQSRQSRRVAVTDRVRNGRVTSALWCAQVCAVCHTGCACGCAPVRVLAGLGRLCKRASASRVYGFTTSRTPFLVRVQYRTVYGTLKTVSGVYKRTIERCVSIVYRTACWCTATAHTRLATDAARTPTRQRAPVAVPRESPAGHATAAPATTWSCMSFRPPGRQLTHPH